MKISMEKKDVMMLNENKTRKGMHIIKYLEYCDCKIIESYTKGSIFNAVVISPSGNTLIFKTYDDIIVNVEIEF